MAGCMQMLRRARACHIGSALTAVLCGLLVLFSLMPLPKTLQGAPRMRTAGGMTCYAWTAADALWARVRQLFDYADAPAGDYEDRMAGNHFRKGHVTDINSDHALLAACLLLVAYVFTALFREKAAFFRAHPTGDRLAWRESSAFEFISVHYAPFPMEAFAR